MIDENPTLKLENKKNNKKLYTKFLLIKNKSYLVS